MFRKILCGLVAGTMLLIGSMAFADVINDGILYEFRSRSVVIFAEWDHVATGLNYSVDDVDKVTLQHPYVGVYATYTGECVFYMTLFAQVPMMGGPVECDVLPELMQKDEFFNMGHWLVESDATILFNRNGMSDISGHIDRFWDFVNKEYQEAQRP